MAKLALGRCAGNQAVLGLGNVLRQEYSWLIVELRGEGSRSLEGQFPALGRSVRSVKCGVRLSGQRSSNGGGGGCRPRPP